MPPVKKWFNIMHISDPVFLLIFINIYREGKRDNNIKKRKSSDRDIRKIVKKNKLLINKSITFF